jgi:hypothetical protein
MTVPDYSARKGASNHRAALEASQWAGCFYCLCMFKPHVIREWIDDGETALCPLCAVDSVLPMEQLDGMFLTNMRNYWFGETDDPH